MRGVRRPRKPGSRGHGELVRLALLAAVLLGLWVFLRIRGPEPAITVWDAARDLVVEMGLEAYVRGVVAAEVPADFHLEALKAQAVAARTYALRRVERGERLPEQPAAHVSSDFRRHQAWVSERAFLERWGPLEGARRWALVALAVEATRGVVLTYEGELIEALYHSTSGGHTEDAHRYFAGGQPYLVAVPDPWSEHSPVHRSEARFPVAVVLARLGVADAEEDTLGGVVGAGEAGAPGLVQVLSRTPSGRAAEVSVAGRVYSGRAVREALGLRSTAMSVT